MSADPQKAQATAALDQVLAAMRDYFSPMITGIADTLQKEGVPHDRAWDIAEEICMAQWHKGMTGGEGQ